MLADRIGRVNTLIITVLVYAVFTALCGLAPNYETLLVFRALQGLGFGGEWAAGAILVAEYAAPRHRGRAVAIVQSAWAVGWGLAVIVYTVVFSLFDESVAWRVLFFTGALPALLVVYVRRGSKDAPVYVEHSARRASAATLAKIFTDPLGRTTFFASLLATGCQGGYYTLATWVPTFLKNDRGLTVVGTGGYLAFLITGAFVGYLTGGYFTDKLGPQEHLPDLRGAQRAVRGALHAAPGGARTATCCSSASRSASASSAIFAGIRLLPLRAVPERAARRRAGLHLQRRARRSARSSRPCIGFLAVTYGVGGAITFGALAYALVLIAVMGLPETRGEALK